MTHKRIAARIEKHEIALAKERDKLDELIAHLSQLRDDCDEAIDDLQRARDALSKFV